MTVGNAGAKTSVDGAALFRQVVNIGVPVRGNAVFFAWSAAMDKRIGSIAILVEDRCQVRRINELLTDYGDVIIGRIGVPYRERSVGIISLLVEGTTDEIGALGGKLGMLPGVRAKSLLLTR